MATIQDIAAGSSYQGNAALGGGGGFILDLDMKPIQQLAQYTFLYNKSQYDQRQKDADEKIKELADLTAYDLVNGLDKDKNELIDAQAKLQEYMASFAAKGTPKSPKEKIQQEAEFKGKIQEQIKKINGANQRLISYNLHKAAIEASNDLPGVKAEKIRMLDDQVKNTDIYTPIRAIPNFDLSIPKIGDPVYKTVDAQAIGGDNNVEQTVTYFDGPANDAAALLESGALSDLTTPPGPGASDMEKAQWALRLKSRQGNLIWQDAAKAFNAALNDPNYKKVQTNLMAVPELSTQQPGTEIDFEAIKQKNPVVGNIISLAERYNEYAKERNTEDWVIDEKGYKVILPNQPDKKLRIIDISKGLTPQDVVYLEKFSKAAPDKLESKVTHTGEASANYRAKLNEQGANWRAKLPYTMAKINAGAGATKTEQELYPIKKTWELLRPFIDEKTGLPTNKVVKYSDMTPEQQEKLKAQIIAGGTERLNPDKLSTAKISFVAPTTDHPNGQIRIDGTVTSDNKDAAATVMINPDDITYTYFNDINKNDAGKEAPQRLIFDFNTEPGKLQPPTAPAQNGQEYYNDPGNVQSQKGNTVTYKDGTVWGIKNGKFQKIK